MTQDEDDLVIREDDELMPIEEVCEFLGGKGKPIDRATVYRGVAKGIYHPPVHPSPGISRWVRRWLVKDRARIVSGQGGAHASAA